MPDMPEVTFACSVTVANDTEQATNIAENPICEIQVTDRPPAENTTAGIKVVLK